MRADAVIAIYIIARGRDGTTYAGVTSDLLQRVWQHRAGVTQGFADDHGCRTLVWHEQHESMIEAIVREKAIKRWRPGWKLALIEKTNPQWKGPAAGWFGEPSR